MKAITILFTVAALSLAALGFEANNQNLKAAFTKIEISQGGSNNSEAVQLTRFLSASLRGWITGYRKGMYKENNYKPDPKCFGPETQTALNGIFADKSIIGQEEFNNFITVVRYVTDYCDFDESLYDYLTYCYEGDMCDPGNMMQTLLKKVFQVTTVANDMAQMYAEGVPKPEDKVSHIEDFWERFGQNMGKLLRYATEFDPTLIPSDYA